MGCDFAGEGYIYIQRFLEYPKTLTIIDDETYVRTDMDLNKETFLDA